jgi:hypothetical protein
MGGVYKNQENFQIDENQLKNQLVKPHLRPRGFPKRLTLVLVSFTLKYNVEYDPEKIILFSQS